MGHKPSRAFKKVLLPAPDGPTTIHTVPAGISKVTFCKVMRLSPGGTTLAFFALTWPAIGGSSIFSFCCGATSKTFVSRWYWFFASEKPFQAPTANSTGCNARPTNIDPAMSIPGDISWRSTKNAPAAIAADWTANLRVLVIALKIPAVLLAFS